jgi:hypothetical protein
MQGDLEQGTATYCSDDILSRGTPLSMRAHYRYAATSASGMAFASPSLPWHS